MLIVEDVFSNVLVTCTWMDSMGQRHQGEFDRERLEHFDFSAGVVERSPSGPARIALQAFALSLVAVVTGHFLPR